MYISTLFSAIVVCLALTAQALEIGHHHKELHNGRQFHPNRKMSSTQKGYFNGSHAMWGPGGIWGPGYVADRMLATSYEAAPYGGALGGACGWNQGPDANIPVIIKGAAQKIGFFGAGTACGTCVQLTPLDGEAKALNPAPLVVTVVNSCPGTCASLDVEADVVRANFNVTQRLGQWNAKAEVVPCRFLKNGLHIQYRQISNTVYDLRLSLRFQDGAFAKVQVRRSDGLRWIELKQGETSQMVPKDGGSDVSREVLDKNYCIPPSVAVPGEQGTGSADTIDLIFTSYTGEKVYANGVPNPMDKPTFWFDTNVNFSG